MEKIRVQNFACSEIECGIIMLHCESTWFDCEKIDLIESRVRLVTIAAVSIPPFCSDSSSILKTEWLIKYLKADCNHLTFC